MTSTARLGDVLELQRRAVDLNLEASYVELGVRSFGRGIFLKQPTSGVDLGDKRVFRMEPRDLVVSNVFAWEGAVGVAGPEHEGSIGSHRFMTWTPTGTVDVAYISHYLLSDRGMEQLQQASPGSAGRNRTLSIKNFQAIEVPLPDLSEQRRIAAHLESLHDLETSMAELRLAVRVRSQMREIARNVLAPLTGKWRAGEDFELFGGATPNSDSVHLWEGSVPWVTPTDIGSLEGRVIQRGQRAVADQFIPRRGLIPSGSVVMTSRAPIGNLAITETAMLTNQGCKSFVTEEIDPLYLYFAVMSRYSEYVNVGSGTTFHEVSARKIAEVFLPACDFPTQQRVAKRLACCEELLWRARLVQSRADGLERALLPAARNEIFSAMR